MKDQLITSGYPRSGNTYLNCALNLLYYPQDPINYNRHTVIAIHKANKIIVPFRNPIDAIASWHHYPSREQLHMDIAFYVRFYSHALNNLSKIVLLDFNNFTTDIDYISNAITRHFGFIPVAQVTDTEIKTYMIDNNQEINLPRNNRNELDKTKAILETMPEMQACIDLYNELKIA